MKKILILTFASMISLSLVACGSTPVVEETPAKEAPKTTIEAPAVEVPEVDDSEYERSVKGEQVSKEQFAKDKAEILKKIEELKVIMSTNDFEAWLTYIAPDSKTFFAKPRKIMTNLGVRVNNGLEQYFTDIFIPAREKNSNVQEIRYISPTSIKAVDIPKPGEILTIYNFVKVNNEWLVVLPTDFVL